MLCCGGSWSTGQLADNWRDWRQNETPTPPSQIFSDLPVLLGRLVMWVRLIKLLHLFVGCVSSVSFFQLLWHWNNDHVVSHKLWHCRMVWWKTKKCPCLTSSIAWLRSQLLTELTIPPFNWTCICCTCLTCFSFDPLALLTVKVELSSFVANFTFCSKLHFSADCCDNDWTK